MFERINNLRWLTPILIALTCVGVILSCSDKGSNPVEKPLKISDPESFFPITDGNFWSYNNGTLLRQLDGDTIVNGTTCSRLLVGGETSEAWTKDVNGFYQHLLDGSIWFDPPLPIPFSLEKDSAYHVYSVARELGDTAALASFSGLLTFRGYTSSTVGDYKYDSLVHLEYQMNINLFYADTTIVNNFDEYYARNVGLVYSPDSDPTDNVNDALYLDSAVISGVKRP